MVVLHSFSPRRNKLFSRAKPHEISVLFAFTVSQLLDGHSVSLKGATIYAILSGFYVSLPVNPQMKLVGAVELSWPMERRCLRQEGSSFRLSSEKSRKHRKPKATRIIVLLHQFHLGIYIRGITGRAADGLQLSRRESAITGIWWVVFAWYSARWGYNSTALVHSRSRSESSVITAMASKVSVPTSTVPSC